MFAVALVVRLPALSGEPVWDDDYLVAENPFIKSPILAVEAFRHYLFPESVSLHYRPVQNISFALDYFFWNSSAYGYHVTNLLLHATCGVLLYFLLKRLLGGLVTGSAQCSEFTHQAGG